MFRPFLTRKRRLRRAASGLVALALLNVLVAPAASACEHIGAPASADVTRDHAAMPGHGVDQAQHARAPDGECDDPGMAPGGDDCRIANGPCTDSCTMMAGCTATTFLPPDATRGVAVVAQSPAVRVTQHGISRSTAPDLPPPRA